MTTNNLISTPNITGNIGSCTTIATKELSAKGVIIDQYNVVFTNSCSGEIVNQYQYTDYSQIIPFALILTIVILIGIAIYYDNKKHYTDSFLTT